MHRGAAAAASEREEASRLKTEAELVASDATNRLEELTNRTFKAHTALRTEITAAREALQKEFELISKRQVDDAARVERAARALAIRALELDNHALELEQKEAATLASQKRFDIAYNQRKAAVEEEASRLREREIALSAREASLRYSAVEEKRLHSWTSELVKREQRVGEAETAEKERIAIRLASVAKREMRVEERERRVDAAFYEREAALTKREAAADAVRETLNRQRAEAMLQLEAERSQFWAHQQKLSAVVAAETEALLAEQARLRTEFEVEAAAARSALREMSDAVLKMRLQINSAQTSDKPDDTSFLNALKAIELREPESPSRIKDGDLPG